MQHDDSGPRPDRWERTRSWSGVEEAGPGARPLLAGRYRDLGGLRDGDGRADVRSCLDIHLQRAVVGKRVPAAGADAGLPAEATILADLAHPGILPLLDALRLDEGPLDEGPLDEGPLDEGPLDEGQGWLLIFPHLRGRSLDAILRDGPLSATRAVALIRRVARALAVAHAAGVVHRDVAPANLLVHDDDSVTVLDWGLARRSSSPSIERGVVCGTPPWMAPEQAAGDSADVGPAADVYALGAVLWTALAGVAPYGGATGEAATARIRTAAPTPLARVRPGLASWLLAVIEESMARSPTARPADAAAFLELLEARAPA